MELSPETIKTVLKAQKNEITEHFIYAELSKACKEKGNAQVLRRLSEEEKAHYEIWKSKSGKDVKPDRWKIWKYCAIARMLGLTFAIKLMENGEKGAQVSYAEIAKEIPEAEKIAEDENGHESALVEMIDEERLQYVGSMVLGINDALVELTGTLAGLTFALQNTKLVAMAGMITGIAASLSMGASEYLSTKSEEAGKKNPLKASIYTGIVYLLTVAALILPYLLLANMYAALGATVGVVVIVIAGFTFYISVAKGISFKKRFLEMAGISLTVAAISFGIGFIVRTFMGIEI